MAATTTRTISRHDVWKERVGMSETECCVLVCILARHATTGQPVLSTAVREFFDTIGEARDHHHALTTLLKRGWVRVAGKVACTRLYEPTDRGWRILGLEAMRPPRAA